MRAAALLTLTVAACDLQVTDFAGAKVQLTLAGAGRTPAGQHLELWARLGNGNIARILHGPAVDSCNFGAGSCANAKGYAKTQAAFVIARALDENDACLIDCEGNLLVTEQAKPGLCPPEGPRAPQGPLGAQAILTHIRRLNDLQPTPLVALVSWDDAAIDHPVRAPTAMDCMKNSACIGDDVSASERLMRCTAFWERSPHAYTGNPLQLTAPIHGSLLGMLDFTSITPALLYGGITVVTDFSLRDLRELFFTQTKAKVADLDPDEVNCKDHPDTCRGTVFLQGDAGTPARGVFRMRLAPPDPSSPVTGTAAVYTRLDEDPVQF